MLVRMIRSLLFLAMLPALYFAGFIAVWVLTTAGSISLNSKNGARIREFYSPLFRWDTKSPGFHEFVKTCVRPFISAVSCDGMPSPHGISRSTAVGGKFASASALPIARP